MTPTKTTATTTAPAASNQPQNSGTASNCNRYYKVQSGDSCDSIDSKFGISLNQFRSWNTAINSGEKPIENFQFLYQIIADEDYIGCTNLLADYYYCVGVPGATTTPPPTTTKGNGVATPTPRQEHMVSNCGRFYKVQSGDYCDKIASQYRITSSQIISWNPDVGSNCQSLWVDYYICIGLK
jgi:LysM repeat protein